jgi:hypothetical protein
MEVILDNDQKQLPNASSILVLGILSIVFSCSGLGLIFGIIGLIISKDGKKLYDQNPAGWTNYGNFNAGRVMSIIGIVLNSLVFAFLIFYILIFVVIFGAAIGTFGSMAF